MWQNYLISSKHHAFSFSDSLLFISTRTLEWLTTVCWLTCTTSSPAWTRWVLSAGDCTDRARFGLRFTCSWMTIRKTEELKEEHVTAGRKRLFWDGSFTHIFCGSSDHMQPIVSGLDVHALKNSTQQINLFIYLFLLNLAAGATRTVLSVISTMH